MTDTIQPIATSCRAYLEDGILYNEYVGEFTLDATFEVQKQSLELIRAQKIKTIPAIIVFKNIDKNGFKLSVGNYAKAITGFDLVKHLSGAWVVGLSPDIKGIGIVISKIFLKGNMYIVNSLEEAQNAAHLLLSSSKTILE